MTESRCIDASPADQARIRSMPPPNYDVFLDREWNNWTVIGPEENDLRPDFHSESAAIAAAWKHYDRVCAPAMALRMQEIAEWIESDLLVGETIREADSEMCSTEHEWLECVRLASKKLARALLERWSA